MLDTACRVFSQVELPRRDDRGDRARGGDQRADPLPPLRLEARSLPRVPRRGVARASARSREQAIADDPDTLPRRDRRRLHGEEAKIRLVDLWIQALTEASEDTVIATAVRKQIREVHDFFADVIRDGQARGVVHADRDPVAEAWIFVAGGLLGDDRPPARRLARRRPAARPRRAAPLDAPRPSRRATVPRHEKAPAAAPGALPGQAGRRLGDPEFGSAARPAARICRLWRSPRTRPGVGRRCKVRSLYEPCPGLSSSSVK